MLRENNSLGEHGLSSKDKPNELIANLTYSYERLLGFFVRMNFTKKELDSGKELFHASRRLWELFRKGKSTEPSRTKTGFKSYAESVSNAVHQERKKKIEKGLKERVESYLNKSWHLKNTLGEFPKKENGKRKIFRIYWLHPATLFHLWLKRGWVFRVKSRIRQIYKGLPSNPISE